jgi:vesicle coat complex subunit
MCELGTLDINGKAVNVGSVVRVLAVDESVLGDLDPQSRERVLSMVDLCLAVYEVDAYGRAWVEKWWFEGEAHSTSHSLALDPHQMEIK